jgi:hypothetical protein
MAKQAPTEPTRHRMADPSNKQKTRKDKTVKREMVLSAVDRKHCEL